MNTSSINTAHFPTQNRDYTFSQRMAIIFKCVFNRCPRCNHGGISSPIQFPDACPHCGFVYERHNGFLLTALPAVYFGYVLLMVIPTLVLFLNGYLSETVALSGAGIGAVLFPLLFFNYCKMLAIALYYFFLPSELYHENLQDSI
jgi:hypothetical protein